MQIALQVTSMDFVSSVNKPVRIIIVYVIKEIYFKPSEHDECVFYYGKTIFIVYTDDTILLGPDQQEIDNLVTAMLNHMQQM